MKEGQKRIDKFPFAKVIRRKRRRSDAFSTDSFDYRQTESFAERNETLVLRVIGLTLLNKLDGRDGWFASTRERNLFL